MDRIPTRSWIQGKPPILVRVDKIRPTNLIGEIFPQTEYSPILLVKADDNYFYIVDGNHRFFKRVISGVQTLEAWILERSDRRRVYGYGTPLPQYVREWKERVITLKELTDMAKEAYRRWEIDLAPLLPDRDGSTTKDSHF